MEWLGYPLELVASVLRQAISIEPARFQYRFALASAYQRLGRTEQAYHVLRSVTGEQIERVRCAKCIRRIQAIFADHGDNRLFQLCQRRIATLESARPQ